MKPSRVHNFGTYFVTTNTWGRRPLFKKHRMANIFIEVLFRYRTEGRYLLHEFVLMPDHFHLLITPSEITLERAIQFVKGGSSHRIGKELGSPIGDLAKGFFRSSHSWMPGIIGRIGNTFSLTLCEEAFAPCLNNIHSARLAIVKLIPDLSD